MDEMSYLSLLEDSVIAILRTRSRNREESPFIYIGHICGFNVPVVLVILNYTQGINPKVLHTQLASDGNRILECLWQCFQGYTVLSILEGDFGGT
jgi:hypothetical protein